MGPDKAVNINARTQFLKRCGSRGCKLSGWEWEWEWEWEQESEWARRETRLIAAKAGRPAVRCMAWLWPNKERRAKGERRKEAWWAGLAGCDGCDGCDG